MAPSSQERTEQDAPRHRSATSFRLRVTSGAETGKEVWVYASSPGPTRIGSSTVCELVLSDRKVSRRHATVECQSGSLRVVDMQSTNGTTVNGVTIDVTGGQ